MARVKLILPKSFQFSTEIELRINDINYGGHMGNDVVLSLIHEARVRFLKSLGYTELDIEGCAIILSDAVIVYKTQGFYGDRLKIEVAVADFYRVSFDMFYRIFNSITDKEIARIKTGIVFYDYQQQKTIRVPEIFKQACQG